MNHTRVKTPMSRCRAGFGTADITPPVGIYHRFWGAARHDRATGVHRPLRTTVLLLAPTDAAAGTDAGQPHAIIAIDHCLLRYAEMTELRRAVAEQMGADGCPFTLTFSHTHSGGNISLDRLELPGGDLIPAYLASLPEQIARAWHDARQSLEESVLLWTQADCRMGNERDFLDEELGKYVCGLNPEVALPLPVHVTAIRSLQGDLRASLVNYPCHPTTLAWDNTLISPDYVGALRETVETATGAPCLFTLAACGDIGPRFGFTGDVEQADRNGRQVGWAALSALEALPQAAADYVYAGPRISGATIGEWTFQPPDSAREKSLATFREISWTVELPWRDGLPGREETKTLLARYESETEQLRQAGDERGAADKRALAERQRRLLGRLVELPEAEAYPYDVTMWQLGDAMVVAVGGEPYYQLQQELQSRFPEQTLVFITLANGARAGYLPSREAWDRPGLYQTEIAMVGPESLDLVIESIAEHLKSWLS